MNQYMVSKEASKRNFIIGSPEDAESVKWAKKITDIHGIKWHFLKTADKSKLVADSFIEEIAETLILNKWNYYILMPSIFQKTNVLIYSPSLNTL
jgi:hypothetical protein